MTAHSRFRIAAVIGALLAPLALVALATAPAEAASKHKHEVYIYKVEKSVRLAGVGPDGFGESPNPSLSCFGTDNALDGMWSLKSVDQYHAPPFDPDEDPDFPSTSTLGGIYNDKRDVHVEASYPSTVDPAMWHFRFENRAYGDAQLKIFVTCIRDYTEHANGHNHEVGVSHASSTTLPTVAHNLGWAGRTMIDGHTGPFDCPPNTFFVAPGFDLNLTSNDHRLVASYPSFNGRSWAWEFASVDPTGALNPQGHPGGTGPIGAGEHVTLYGKCIDRQVLVGAGHRHAMVIKHLPSPNWGLGFHLNGYQVAIQHGDPKEVQYSCDTDSWAYSGYKAAVGWFYMYDWWEHNWYFGSEPRPKTRTWQFWNGHGVPAKVNLGILCINSRTANPTV